MSATEDRARVRDALPPMDFDARAAFERIAAELERLRSAMRDTTDRAIELEESRVETWCGKNSDCCPREQE